MKWYDWLGLGWYGLLALVSLTFAIFFFTIIYLIGAWAVTLGLLFVVFTGIFLMMCWSILDIKYWDK